MFLGPFHLTTRILHHWRIRASIWLYKYGLLENHRHETSSWTLKVERELIQIQFLGVCFVAQDTVLSSYGRDQTRWFPETIFGELNMSIPILRPTPKFEVGSLVFEEKSSRTNGTLGGHRPTLGFLGSDKYQNVDSESNRGIG